MPCSSPAACTMGVAKFIGWTARVTNLSIVLSHFEGSLLSIRHLSGLRGLFVLANGAFRIRVLILWDRSNHMWYTYLQARRTRAHTHGQDTVLHMTVRPHLQVGRPYASRLSAFSRMVGLKLEIWRWCTPKTSIDRLYMLVHPCVPTPRSPVFLHTIH